MSTAFHPQTDGQTEVVNRCVELYLRCFCSHKPKDWANRLHWAEFWFNTNWHTSTKLTPYHVVYGKLPPTVLTYIPKTAKLPAVEEQLQARDLTL